MNWQEFTANVKVTQDDLERQVKWMKRLSAEWSGSTEAHIWAAIRKVEEAVEELGSAIDV